MTHHTALTHWDHLRAGEQEQKKAGQKINHGSGFGGKGFKFDEAEQSKLKEAQLKSKKLLLIQNGEEVPFSLSFRVRGFVSKVEGRGLTFDVSPDAHFTFRTVLFRFSLSRLSFLILLTHACALCAPVET